MDDAKGEGRMNVTSQKALTAKVKNNEPRIESKLIANGLGVQHRYLVNQIQKYQCRLKAIGVLRFETSKPNRQGGRPERLVYLNENQCFFLVTLSKNTERAVDLKFAIVMAFSELRENLASVTDYLPNYREAHDNLAQLVRINGSSVPESRHHANLERMINKALKAPAGSRKQLPAATRSAIAVAERIASVAYEQALHKGQDHKAAYQNAKTGVINYAKTVVPILPLLECA
jgi:phage regulator Rha-like protein|tara:strand:+ start:153 stop:845 length:693 start_codon:yes stop_codon:yes gene_type:complete